MKKITLILLFALYSLTLQNAFAGIPITDSKVYTESQTQQQQADEDVRDRRSDTQYETSVKNRMIGGINDFTNSTLEFINPQTTTDGVSGSLSPEGSSSSETIPEGVNGSDFFRETLLPPTNQDGKDRTEEAGIANTAKSKGKRERALVEVATFGYALAAINKEQASRNLGGKTNIDTQVQNQTNSSENYSSSVSNNTSVKMSSAQIYNAIVLTAATNNMLTAISSADYVTNTNVSFKEVVAGMAIQAAGSMLGSFLK